MKKTKWSYGIAASLVLGLSGCYMDGEHAPPPRADVSVQSVKASKQEAVKEAKVVRKGSSAEAALKSTPGPKRTAAPQIPVIQ
jgi:hypothetical protein